MSQASSVAILLMLVGAIILQWSEIVSLIGTGGIYCHHHLPAGVPRSRLRSWWTSDPATRSVMGLGTANATCLPPWSSERRTSPTSPTCSITVVVAGLIGLVLLMPIGAELGKHAEAKEATSDGAAKTGP